MSSNELARKTEVERALDHRITQREAANKLGITERQFRRILQRYRQEGDKGLVSRKRRKPRNRRMDIEIGDKAREFIKQSIMKGFGSTLMAEKLGIQKGICPWRLIYALTKYCKPSPSQQ
jgi:transposase